MTYLILANNAEEDETRRFLWVNICNTVLSYFQQEENGIKQALDKIRLLSRSDKAAAPPMPLR